MDRRTFMKTGSAGLVALSAAGRSSAEMTISEMQEIVERRNAALSGIQSLKGSIRAMTFGLENETYGMPIVKIADNYRFTWQRDRGYSSYGAMFCVQGDAISKRALFGRQILAGRERMDVYIRDSEFDPWEHKDPVEKEAEKTVPLSLVAKDFRYTPLEILLTPIELRAYPHTIKCEPRCGLESAIVVETPDCGEPTWIVEWILDPKDGAVRGGKRAMTPFSLLSSKENPAIEFAGHTFHRNLHLANNVFAGFSEREQVLVSGESSLCVSQIIDLEINPTLTDKDFEIPPLIKEG